MRKKASRRLEHTQTVSGIVDGFVTFKDGEYYVQRGKNGENIDERKDVLSKKERIVSYFIVVLYQENKQTRGNLSAK